MKSSKYKFLILTLCTTALLTSCKEENRDNPLRSKNQIEILTFISDNRSDEIKTCSKYWSNPQDALKIEINSCKGAAVSLADKMNSKKFTDDLIIPEDLNLPYIWQKYYSSMSFNTYDTKKAAEAFAPIQPFNKNYKAK